jgi:hypothetical protein
MSTLSPRTAITSGLAVLAGVAIFAAGFFVAEAGDEDRDQTAPGARAGSNTVVAPGIAGGAREPALVPSVAAGRGGAADAGSKPASFPYPAGCQQPIDGVLKDGKIDLSQVGFEMNALGQGFQLTNVSFSAMGICQPDGSVKDARLTLSTSYVHTRSKITVFLTQVKEPKPEANVRYQGSATFWRNGYQYTVNGGYQAYPVDEPVAGGGVNSSPRSTPPAAPGIAPDYPGPGSAELEAAITEAIAQLAPDLGAACFYRQTEGSWSDLGAIGVGDPRPAIPQGFTESSANFWVFTPPDASCGLPATTPPPASFAATWESRGSEGFISVNASGLVPGTDQYPGFIGPDGANWTNGRYQFSVGGRSSQGSLGLDAVRALARALDPQFDNACFFQQRTLTPADLAALGLRAPVPPSGYRITRSDLSASELGANCTNVPQGVGNSYSLNWDLEGPDNAQVNVNISRQEGQPGQAPGGYRSPSGFTWWDSRGTFYNVYGFSKGGSGNVSQDVLIAIAKSIDPTFDPDTLDNEPKPMPLAEGVLPATPSAR